MATTPPEQPTQPGPPPGQGGYQGGYQGGPGYGPGYGYRPGNAGKTLEKYIGFGNPEFGLYVVVSLILVALWAWGKEIEDQSFLTSWTAVTFAYLISRGIAKASRVHEPTDTTHH